MAASGLVRYVGNTIVLVLAFTFIVLLNIASFVANILNTDSSFVSEFPCPVCGKLYKSVSSMRNHKSIYHRNSGHSASNMAYSSFNTFKP